MGYDATNFVPNNISKEKLFNLIDLLGFKGNGKLFFFYKEDNYKYLESPEKVDYQLFSPFIAQIISEFYQRLNTHLPQNV